MNPTFSDIGAAVARHNRFLVVSHMRPDGDALGSTLALALALQKLGKTVTAWNEDGLLEKFRWLPCGELVSKPPVTPQEFDVVFILDNAVKERAGTPLASVAGSPFWINLDHHFSNPGYGDLNFIDAQSPATGQILFELFTSLGWDISPAIAENLFVAISSDTGSFQYPATTARTYEIGGELIRRGADVGRISRDLYDSYPLRRIQLLRSLLNELLLTSDQRVASIALTEAAAREIGAIPDDNEGLIDHIRAIDSVIVAIFFEELPEGRIRLSIRSKDPRVSAAAICQHFGGGGHILAAGARVQGSLNEVRSQVLEFIDHEIRSHT